MIGGKVRVVNVHVVVAPLIPPIVVGRNAPSDNLIKIDLAAAPLEK